MAINVHENVTVNITVSSRKKLQHSNKEFCVLHVQSNTTIFHLVVQ